MNTYRASLLAAILILTAATSAQAYTEKWSGGWFFSGTITYNSTTWTYDHLNTIVDSYIYTWTYDASVDSITGNNVGDHRAIFYNSDKSDSLIITLSDYSSYKKLLGTKTTGTSGTKEGSGTWSAYCSNKGFYLGGTWDTNGATAYFNYNVTPPTGNGAWTMTWTSSASCTAGSGTWGIVRTEYNP